MQLRIAALAGTLTLAACPGSPVGAVCLAVESPAIQVEVRDAATGRPAAGGARGEVREGAFSDSLRVVGWTAAPHESTAFLMAAAYERAGTYTVEVTRPGYRTWRATDVRVVDGRCGPETRRLTAELVAEPGS